jgi:hypothetical protein
MKKLVFLFLILLLLGLNFSCSKKIDSEETIKKCKDECSKYNNNDPDFCNRICEKEIFDPRWKFFIFDKEGSAWFYDLESISTSHDIVPVWMKVIVSERVRQNRIKKIGKKAEKFNLGLLFFQIDCSGKKYRWLAEIAYDYNGSILEEKNYSENSTIWVPIPPNTLIEQLSKEVCKK